MLKTYRIIPLVFILFLFGFTLITVAPVLALSAQEKGWHNERRINALEELLCSLPGTASSLCKRVNMHKDAREAKEAKMEADRERAKNWGKDPFTYSPDGSSRQSPDGKFRCVGFPEIRENPNEPRGVALAKCKQKFGEATGNTAPPPPKKFFCADFPEALNYQECMHKKNKAKECKRNPSMC